MIKEADNILRQINELLEEAEVYFSYKKRLLEALKSLHTDYLRKKFGYLEYQGKLRALLKDKTKGEFLRYYNAYIYSLFRKIDFLLAELYNYLMEEKKADLENKKEDTKELAAEQRFKEDAEKIFRAKKTQERQHQETAFMPAARPEKNELDSKIEVIRQRLSQKGPSYKSYSSGYVVVKRPEISYEYETPHMAEQELIAEPFPQQGTQQLEGQKTFIAQQGKKEFLVEEPLKLETKKGLKEIFLVLKNPRRIFGTPKIPLEFFSVLKNKFLSAFKLAKKLGINAAGILTKLKLPEIKIKEGIKKEQTAAKPGDEIDFYKIAQKPKLYSAQKLRMLEKQKTGVIGKKESSIAGLLRGFWKKIMSAPILILKIPLNTGRLLIAAAKLPVKAALGAAKLTIGAAGLIKKLGKLIKRKPEEKKAEESKIAGREEPFASKIRNFFAPQKKTIFVEEIIGIEKEVQKAESLKLPQKAPGILAGGIMSTRLFSDILRRFGKKEEKVLGERTEIPEHIKKLREMREKVREEAKYYGFEQTLLAKEARRVKEILEAEKVETYKGSSIGAMANLFVKKTSVSLVNAFPELFEYLYNALRAANIKILSNTYVSIMVFISMAMFLATTAALSFVFLALNYPLYQIFLRTFFFGFLAATLTAIFFYAYPFMKISERKKNITANMPFAINHLAAVSASGVPPSKMLELISESKEYGEIAAEFKKIVDLMNIFGYDLLTAIKSVSATTPSPAFKEILDGMVSTIETGGDLENYLKEKAEEATLTYRLERQKYNESISTYSDIYTGLLIAAPLFFVAALAMINLLGGTIGGFGIEAIMAFGAYLVIPLLNIGFLIFLQVSQPEV